MPKNSKLSKIEQAQIKAFLKIYDENESIQINPHNRWSTLIDCGLTIAKYHKLLNKLAELGYIQFEDWCGSVSFHLTKAGKIWLAETD